MRLPAEDFRVDSYLFGQGSQPARGPKPDSRRDPAWGSKTRDAEMDLAQDAERLERTLDVRRRDHVTYSSHVRRTLSVLSLTRSGGNGISRYPRKSLATAMCAALVAIVTCAGPLFGETSEQQARDTLRAGLNERSTTKRTQAVRVLGLVSGDSEAAEMAQTALKDPKPEVRAAAATALGPDRLQGCHSGIKEGAVGQQTCRCPGSSACTAGS